MFQVYVHFASWRISWSWFEYSQNGLRRTFSYKRYVGMDRTCLRGVGGFQSVSDTNSLGGVPEDRNERK